MTPSQARHIVNRMGETGQPPERGALAANVGTGALLDVLRDEYLLPMKESGRNSSFKLVQAPFGGGKTHFLHCLREVAWQHGFASSLVGVSPDACPFDAPAQIYQEVARNLELPPASDDEESQPGIDAVLRLITEQRRQQHGAEAVRAWLRHELPSMRIDSSAVRRAAMLLMEALLDSDFERVELLGAFLRGEAVAASDLLALQIREELGAATAFRFLRSLAQLLRALQVPGVVLLFDELDRVMSLTVRRRRAIGDNLRQMIDHCGQSTLPSVLWVYAVPPEFMTNIVPEYPALEQRLRGPSTFATTSPLAPIIDLDRLALDPVALYEQIGARLCLLYDRAHGISLTAKTQQQNMKRLARELGANQLESGTRRTFVKAAVQMLTRQHRGGEKLLDETDVRDLGSRAVRPEPAPLDGEEEAY